MLREIHPNVSAPGLAAGGLKPFLESAFSLPFSANACETAPPPPPPPPPQSGGVTGPVIPIPPASALAELEAIRQRLLVLAQGMSAWNTLVPAADTDSRSGDSLAASQALAKLREDEVLLDQCTVLQSLQQQLDQERLSASPPSLPLHLMPGFHREANEGSQSIPSIFAPPQYQQTFPQHQPPRPLPPQQQPSLRSSSPSSASRRGTSPAQLGTDTETEDNEVSKPGERPSYSRSGRREPRTATHASGSGVVRRVPWPPQKDSIVAIVEFKRQRMKRCLCEAMIEPGKYVILPGDRGYDCGLVVQCGKYDVATSEMIAGSVRTMDAELVDPEDLKGDMVPITREATLEEVQQLYSTQAAKERLALRRCRELVQQLQLDMNVVDCEYQFDGTKISFYFEANHSIDFRDLNKELYRVFNARIWLENVNNSVKNVVPEGALSKSDKAQYRRSGLRIPFHH